MFCGLFPVNNSEYQKLKDGIAKLKLNDSSFSYESESSSALGLGFRWRISRFASPGNHYSKARKGI